MFNDLPLLFRECVQIVHQLVDLLIRRRNLPLQKGLLLVGPGLGKSLTDAPASRNSFHVVPVKRSSQYKTKLFPVNSEYLLPR